MSESEPLVALKRAEDLWRDTDAIITAEMASRDGWKVLIAEAPEILAGILAAVREEMRMLHSPTWIETALRGNARTPAEVWVTVRISTHEAAEALHRLLNDQDAELKAGLLALTARFDG